MAGSILVEIGSGDVSSDAALQRKRTIEQAAAEGHDADIPSRIGFVVNQNQPQNRTASLASRHSSSAEKSTSEGFTTEKSGQQNEADLETAGGNAAAVSSGQGDESIRTAPTDDDPNTVWWDGENDPQNPYNWPRWRILVNCLFISGLTFLTPLASSMFAPGVPQLMREFNSTNTELAAFVVSIYVLGFAFGPILFAPLSEIYGRNIVYHVCNLGFIAFVIGCALAPTLESLLAFRFLSGLFGSCPVTNGGGSIADMIPQEKRAAIMAMYAIGPLLGPIIGPVAGGFLADARGWRWTFWLLAIVGGVLAIGMLAFMRETYAPILLEKKAAKLRKERGNPLLRSKLDAGLSSRDYFARSIVRPIKMMIFSPITQIFALYMAVVYGYLYLLFTTITPVFIQSYGFTTATVGLVFLGLGIGSMTGLAVFSTTSDKYIKRQAERDGQGMKPEYRLKLLPIGAVVLPAGFFLYGWSAEYRLHWIVPILGTTVIGIANLIVFMAVQLYLVDAFSVYAASALAANTIIRSIAGAVLPLVALRMYDRLGLGWGNSLLAFIALAMLPIPFLIQRYGEHLRTKFTVNL